MQINAVLSHCSVSNEQMPSLSWSACTNFLLFFLSGSPVFTAEQDISLISLLGMLLIAFSVCLCFSFYEPMPTCNSSDKVQHFLGFQMFGVQLSMLECSVYDFSMSLPSCSSRLSLCCAGGLAIDAAASPGRVPHRWHKRARGGHASSFAASPARPAPLPRVPSSAPTSRFPTPPTGPSQASPARGPPPTHACLVAPSARIVTVVLLA